MDNDRAQPKTHRQIDAAEMREVLGHFCSGVTIVTALLEGEPVGMTCQSFFSLSLDPPLVAFSPSKSSLSYPRIRGAGAFCVNVLAKDQEALCRTFARSGSDKWSGVEWRSGPTSSPVLDGVHAWVDCSLETEHDGGDHYITIGRVVDLGTFDGEPLLFYRGTIGGLGVLD